MLRIKIELNLNKESIYKFHLKMEDYLKVETNFKNKFIEYILNIKIKSKSKFILKYSI